MFLNDLNMFDKSRDAVFLGCQHASQLERSIELVSVSSLCSVSKGDILFTVMS